MATGRLSWDAQGSRYYESGVHNCVLYVWDKESSAYGDGVAWNGITAVNENPSGADATALYADNIKYLNLIATEEFGATIEAYTYPDEFMACDGSASLTTGVYLGQQNRTTFGLCYRTEKGNDTDGISYGYKLHLVYGALAAPSAKDYSTINDSPEAITFSWEISTTPIEVGTINGVTYKPTATLVIDSSKVEESKMTALENELYGSENKAPTLLTPAQVYAKLTAQ